MTQPTLRALDLFSGAGGFHYGLRGIAHVVLACEIDKHARATYRANFPGTPIANDVRALTDPPEHDLLCGGFPCQPFSPASFDEKHAPKGFGDSRGTLFFEIVRILKQRRPAAFILENVPGLVGHDNGRTLRVVLAELGDAGYAVDWREVNSEPWVPQKRKRIFFLGVRDDSQAIDLDLVFRLHATHIVKPPRPWPVAASALHEFVDIHPSAPWPTTREMTLMPDRSFDLSPTQRAYTLRSMRRTEDEGIRLTDPRRATRTLLTDPPTGAGRTAILFGDGVRVRGLTPREGARLQGFPDWFVLPESRTQAYQQMGNAVVPAVVRAVAQALVPLLARDGARYIPQKTAIK